MQDEDWTQVFTDAWSEAEDIFRDETELSDFIDEAQALFEAGWNDHSISTAEREAAWSAFFDLMDEFDISIESYDWDSWRDWYND